MEGPSQTEPSATQVIGRVLPAADDALVDADAALPPNLGRWLGPIHGHPTRAGPARRPCPGRMTVDRPEPPAEIRWECGVCVDQGVISGWEDSPYDLRRRGLGLAGSLHDVVLSHDMAAALRELRLLDADCERLVYRIRADGDVAVLAAADEDLDELADSIAAEGNHEPNGRRQRRLDAVYDALDDAIHAVRDG